MLKIEFTNEFKKDFKKAIKRGCQSEKLENVISLLAQEMPLPVSCRDHPLRNSRNYKNVRECHIEPDWLLVYRISHDTLILTLLRTGSHSDLF